MVTPATDATARRLPLWSRILLGIVGLLVALVLVVMFFPWNKVREPINRYVSEKTGRKFEITRQLDVAVGWRSATVKLDGVEFANPAWARDPYLVKAERAEFDIRLWPLLRQRIDIPRLSLVSPVVGLQMEADGRRTWVLGGGAGEGAGTTPKVGAVQVDGGALDFLAEHLGVDLHADLSFDTTRGDLPLSYKIKGKYQRQALTAQGRTGNVLQLTGGAKAPFPLEIEAAAGHTRLTAAGTLTELAPLDGIDAKFTLKGQNLGDLFPLLGIALPQTSPYALAGDLRKRGALWEVGEMSGKLGLSDIGGDMRFDQAQKVPFLSGSLRSRVMDMDDLGPLIGLPPTARSAHAVDGVAPPPSVAQVKRAQRDPGTKVLPTAPLDFERLRAMNADVKYVAERIRNVRELPLDRGSVHVKLQDSVLALDPLDLGVAGGKVAGAIRIDASNKPADIRAALDVGGLQLARLVPKLEGAASSVGRLDGRLNIAGTGASVASWLGGASGDVAVLMGGGQVGNLLPVYATLVGGDILKFLVRGDRDVRLRCAAMAFDMNKGVMTGRTLVLDTSNAVFNASGQVNLANETLDLVIRPEPKNASILSLRTPLTVGGTLANPRPGIEAGPLLARAAAVVAGAAINPLVALAATLETGSGQDANCGAVLADARTPDSKGASQAAEKAKAIRK